MKKLRRRHVVTPSPLRAEAEAQMWFAAGQLVPLCANVCGDALMLVEGAKCVTAAAAARDLVQMEHELFHLRWTALQEKRYTEVEAELRQFSVLHQLCRDVSDVRARLWPEGWTEFTTVPDAEHRLALTTLHGGMRETRRLWSGSDVGMVASMLVEGVPLGDALDAAGVALGQPATNR